MISVNEAKEIIKKHVKIFPAKALSIKDAGGKMLAETIYATIDIPAFPQSSMDGYAFCFADWQINKKLIIEGEIAAGDNQNISWWPGKAIRIFTGAPVPAGADTVVMQEKTTIDSSATQKILSVADEQIQPGTNVRPAGSEIKKGESALEKNTLLTPAAIGFLAGIGVSAVKVFPNPSISIIVTGKELQSPGSSLEYGQVYESNSFALIAALQQLQFTNLQIFSANDDLDALTNTLHNALQQSDMILLTGGISAGDYDFVSKAAEKCGIEKLFHKIKQRPGKPLFFGKKENKIIFGLPGNPSSVLTCFYEYVLLALSIQTNHSVTLKKLKLPLETAYNKNNLLTCFLKGSIKKNVVTILDGQESYKMRSFAVANCLVKLEEPAKDYERNELVEVHLLPE